MKSINELLYTAACEPYRSWVNNARGKKKTWEEILFACKENDEGLKKFLDDKRENDFWDISSDEWKSLVKEMKKANEGTKPGFIGGDPKKPLIGPPSQSNSCWMKYKAKLAENGFTYGSIQSIEKSSTQIFSYLSQSTEENDPIRGMVVGNVQSGKTANMAGVISMAADYGFNFFIVLTGTIDNLRKQTRQRLLSDLDYEGCPLKFTALDNPSQKNVLPYRLQDLHLTDSTSKYLCVCLKNSARLKQLLNWINKDENAKSKLKVLVIDDEADQAGVNTKDVNSEEQTAISRLIKNLVFHRDAKDSTRGGYLAMNYVGYTATPYANLLNESGNDTLYPKNFIALLNPASEYFGPQQIFGVASVNDPLNVVNKISDEEVNAISSNQCETSNGDLQDSLKDALLWFAITVACFRYWNLKKPVSMLIHTSQIIEKHAVLAAAIEKYLNSCDFDSLKDELRRVYGEQTANLTLSDFKESMPEYNKAEEIHDYPPFDELIPYLERLLDQSVTHIGLDEGGALLYSSGIHLCIDNCKQNADDKSIEMRIVYPEDLDKVEDPCPAFIVIGGATLSRGLTLQGLTTSYFLRNTNQADALMQMARWFGFRRGYELLQRIWLSKQTKSKFDRLAKLDYDLRQELRAMSLKGLSPQTYGPRLDSFPDYKCLVLAPKNKTQGSIECRTTFYNKTAQTTWFHRNSEILKKNYETALAFLNGLGDVDREKIDQLKNPNVQPNSLMWFGVDYVKVIDFLAGIAIPKQAACFDDYEALKTWYKQEFDKGMMDGWTVVAGGLKDKIHNDVKLDCGEIINLENRSAYRRDGASGDFLDNYVDLKTITQAADRFIDIDCSKMNDYDKSEFCNPKQPFLEKRLQFASKKSPLLIVYIIDKDSEVAGGPKKGNGYVRFSLKDLNLCNHLVGYYIYIPYGVGKNEGYVTIKLKYDPTEKEGETNEN